MARLVTTGFEAREKTADGYTTVGGTLSYDTGTFRSGAASLKIVPVSNQGDIRFAPTFVLGRTYYARGYFLMPSLGTSFSTDLIVFTASSTTVTLQVWFNGLVRVTGPGVVTTDTALGYVQAGNWYRAELAVNLGTGSVDTVEARIDGVVLTAQTGLTVFDGAISTIDFSSSFNDAGSIFWDDVAVNDDQGASQNSFPGEGKVVLLVPTADSAVGTGWTLGTGTAISANSGATAVDNEPPVGVADLAVGSDPKQIRNASSNASVNYDATMTTYAAAGLAPVDTINVIDPIIVTAAPVTTSSKQGTVGVVSNPAIANVALGAGGTAGAFWSGVAAGTYPTGWKVSHGTVTYASSVTVATAPVMRVTQVTASTRIAMVCFMGMYVDYSPGHSPWFDRYPPFLVQ